MKKILLLLLCAPLAALASGGVRLDPLPDTPAAELQASRQRGAQVFVNYCLNCHAAAYMRYNRLQDIGLTEDQIRANLLFATDKVGNTMTVAINRKEAAEWFGVAPPDLTVIARSRSADWLYTYFRTFYRDDATPSGWNNLAFPNVGMPHVLWELQGTQAAQGEKEKKLALAQPGKLSAADYDKLVRDLVNYLVYMGEPAQDQRRRVGLIAVLFLGVVLLPLAYALKKEYWKDVH